MPAQKRKRDSHEGEPAEQANWLSKAECDAKKSWMDTCNKLSRKLASCVYTASLVASERDHKTIFEQASKRGKNEKDAVLLLSLRGRETLRIEIHLTNRNPTNQGDVDKSTYCYSLRRKESTNVCYEIEDNDKSVTVVTHRKILMRRLKSHKLVLNTQDLQRAGYMVKSNVVIEKVQIELKKEGDPINLYSDPDQNLYTEPDQGQQQVITHLQNFERGYTIRCGLINVDAKCKLVEWKMEAHHPRREHTLEIKIGKIENSNIEGNGYGFVYRLVDGFEQSYGLIVKHLKRIKDWHNPKKNEYYTDTKHLFPKKKESEEKDSVEISQLEDCSIELWKALGAVFKCRECHRPWKKSKKPSCQCVEPDCDHKNLQVKILNVFPVKGNTTALYCSSCHVPEWKSWLVDDDDDDDKIFS
eukprot:jgi/Bigna1/129278/aug1.8_g3986